MNTIENLARYLQGAPFAALFFDAFLKSLIVLGLAGGVCALWRSTSSATRHLVWFLAVASLPFLPLTSSIHPAWQKPAWAISSSTSAGNQISLALELAPQTAAHTAPNTSETTKISTTASSIARNRTATTHFNAHWMLMGETLWLAGAVAVLLRLVGGHGYRRKLILGTRRLQDDGWAHLLSDVGERLHLRRPVTLLLSANKVMPMTWGWWRPVVLLPASAAQWSLERRRVVLLHELAHIKRGDYLTQILAQLVCALYWFNPLVWLAARQLCTEREGACDDLVLTGGCKASEYAGHLVDIAGSFRRLPQMAAIAMARSSQLEGRIAAIVDKSRNRRLRSATAVAILALIGGIAICLGSGGPASTVGAEKSDSLLRQQIEQLKTFSALKEKQAEALAAASGEKFTPEFQRYFDAAISGDWQTVTNMYEDFKQNHPQYSHTNHQADLSLRTSYWSPVLEISLAYDHVVRCEPAYTWIAVDGIINSIPAGSIYFGGTDPGRGLPTAFCKSQVDADPFYTLTQNALADGTYLEYLRKTYGNQKGLLGKIAEAYRTNGEFEIPIPILWEEVKKLQTELIATQHEIAEAKMEKNTDWREAKVSDLERKAELQEKNLNYFVSQFEQEHQDRVKKIAADVQAQAGNQTDINTLYIPTEADSQQCFQDYVVDAQKRLANNQLKPREDIKVTDGRTQISGQTAVMGINARLAKVIFDKNPGHEFYIEESFPLDWMYPYLEPHGLIMKINREPLASMPDATVQQDRDFWQPRVTQMIGGWLTDDTSVDDVVSFAEKIFLRHDLGGFSGDPLFVQNDYASRSFSKWRLGIAGLYAWRAENVTAVDEKVRMARAADFAFRQALALCPYSSEAATRYAEFLKQQQHVLDAQSVQAMAGRFVSRSVKLSATSAPPVFQIRLALGVPTDNTEPMRLEYLAAPARTLYVAREVLLDDTALESAKLNQNPSGRPRIDVSMTDAGRERFAEVTRQHLHQQLAIVIGGKLWAAPVIESPITGGKAQIDGSFSDEEAKELTAKINESLGK